MKKAKTNILASKPPKVENYSQGIPAKSYVKISSSLKVSSQLYDVILEGALVGLPAEYMAEHLNLQPNIVKRIRQYLFTEGYVPRIGTGSRIPRYRPVKRFTPNGVALPDLYSKYWNLGPLSTELDASTFRLPVLTEKDFVQSRKFTDKYLLPVGHTVKEMNLIQTVECEGAINPKKDFIVNKNKGISDFIETKVTSPTNDKPTEPLESLKFLEQTEQTEQTEVKPSKTDKMKVQVEETTVSAQQEESLQITINGVTLTIAKSLIEQGKVSLTPTGIKIV